MPDQAASNPTGELKRVGAAWVKTSTKGNSYISVSVNFSEPVQIDAGAKLYFKLFPVKAEFKTGPNSPDYNVLMSV